MVKHEHLAKIEESVDDWNMWRHLNPEIVPAFWGADLEELDLKGAYLDGADLEEANLSGADLRDADLREAKLRDADLKGANLERANLMGTILKSANLEGASLRWAMHLQAEQLCEAYTLYQAKLDPEIERLVKKERPQLFAKPGKKAYH